MPITCPKCKAPLTSKFIIHARNSLIKGRGRKPMPKPCKWGCGESMGIVKLKAHEPRCANNPRNTERR